MGGVGYSFDQRYVNNAWFINATERVNLLIGMNHREKARKTEHQAPKIKILLILVFLHRHGEGEVSRQLLVLCSMGHPIFPMASSPFFVLKRVSLSETPPAGCVTDG